MKNLYNFIIYFLFISILYGRVITETDLSQQDDSVDSDMNVAESEEMVPEDNTETEDDIIRQRRKAIENLLNHFKDNMKKEESAENNKRSLNWKNQQMNSNYWRPVNEIYPLENDDLEDLEETGNVLRFRDVAAGNATAAGNRSKGDKAKKLIDLQRNQKPNNNQELLGRKGYFSRNYLKNDIYNAQLRDLDDKNLQMASEPMESLNKDLVLRNPRTFFCNPYSCCLCGQCNHLDQDAKNYLIQQYVTNNVAKLRENDLSQAAIDSNNYETIQFPRRNFEPLHKMQSLRDPPSSSAAAYRNNLSHEANYKLSKLEQDSGERPGNYSWLWPNFVMGRRRSTVNFNPMDEVKLKTSSRLMQRGFGPSLPSESLGEFQRNSQFNNIIRSKEMEIKRLRGKCQDCEGLTEKLAKAQREIEDTSKWEEKSKENTEGDWNKVRQKRITENWRENKEKRDNYFQEHERLKREIEFKRMGHIKRKTPKHFNGGHKNILHRRSKRSLENLPPIVSHQVRHRRYAPSVEDPYEDYDQTDNSKKFQSKSYQDLIDNDLENLNKDTGRYKNDVSSNSHSDYNKDLYKRKLDEQKLKKIFSNMQQRAQTHIAPEDKKIDSKNYLYQKSLNELANNLIKYKSDIDTEENEIEHARHKNLAARTRPRHRKKKKKGKSKLKVREMDNLDYELYNTNKQFLHPHSTDIDQDENWMDHYKDLKYRSATDDNNSTKKDSKISLELRNEILNCTAYANLKNFLDSLPKNLTADIKKPPEYEEVKMDITTEEIKGEITENPPESATEQPASEETTELSTTTTATETATEEECDDDESPTSPTDDGSPTDDNDNDSEETPMPEPSTPWDDNTTSPMPESVESSLLPPDQDDLKLNITINANLRGNTKNKHFKGDGTIDVKPSMRDTRYVRHVKKRKSMGSSSPPTDDSNSLLNDLSSGKLSSNIVRTIFGEVQENPQLKVLWPILRRNPIPQRVSQPYLSTLRNFNNEDQIEQSHELMSQAVDAINSLVDQQIRSKQCIPLRPDLQEFYDLINNVNWKKNNNQGYRQNMKAYKNPKEWFPPSLSELSETDQEDLQSIKRNLLSEETLNNNPWSSADFEKTKRNLHHYFKNEDSGTYSPQFLKLKKASDLYRSILSESNDGGP